MKRKKLPFEEKRQKPLLNIPDQPKWVDLNEVLEVLYHPDFYWGADNDFIDLKYLELRIDTRDLHCIVKDRNGKIVDFDEVKETLNNVNPLCQEMNQNKL